MQTVSDERLRPVTSRATFSLGFVFLMLSLAALAIPTFFLPGGYPFYGSLLVIFLLSAVLIAQIRKSRVRFKEWTLSNSWKATTVFTALLLSVITFVPLSSIAYDYYAQEQLRALQLNQIQDILNDGNFLKTALDLHQQMLGPGVERHLRGNSELVPREIKTLCPISVNASEDCLTVQLSRNNDRMLVIYSPQSSLPRVHGKKIENDVYYWDRRRR